MTSLAKELQRLEAIETAKAAIAPQISEGIGAVLRKFCESPEAAAARKALHAMPTGDWDTLVKMLATASAEAAVEALLDGAA